MKVLQQLVLASVSLCATAGLCMAGPGDELYRDGHYARALARWETAAKAGDAGAAYRLGAALMDGVVVDRNLAEAAHWLGVSARRGDPRAQLDLATLYDRGWGVEQSHALALRWYREAALRGQMAGQFNLASMYEQGQGVVRDPAEAYTWYHLAVRQGIGAIGRESLERLALELGPEEVERSLESARLYEAGYRR